jgi:hypothetical protein
MMKKIAIFVSLIFLLALFPIQGFCQTIDVLIKGIDDGIKSTKQRDYMEAVMNAKLQAIERAGVEIQSITVVENFQLKYDMVESKANALLLPGFQIIDMGYQTDGTYQVVLAGKVQVGKMKRQKGEYWGKLRSEPAKMRLSELEGFKKAYTLGKIRNDFEDNKDETVTDWATGLMWTKKNLWGDCYQKLNERVHNEMNNNKFAGYSDWRVPTLEELLSIKTIKPMSKGVEYTPNPVFFIDPIFAPPDLVLWSSDIILAKRVRGYSQSCPSMWGRHENEILYECGSGVGFRSEGHSVETFVTGMGGVYIKGIRSIK